MTTKFIVSRSFTLLSATSILVFGSCSRQPTPALSQPDPPSSAASEPAADEPAPAQPPRLAAASTDERFKLKLPERRDPKSETDISILFATARLVLLTKVMDIAPQLRGATRMISISEAAGQAAPAERKDLLASFTALLNDTTKYIDQLDAFTSLPSAKERAGALPQIQKTMSTLQKAATALESTCAAALKENTNQLNKLQTQRTMKDPEDIISWGDRVSSLNKAVLSFEMTLVEVEANTRSTFELAVSPESDK